ncbi:DNA-dependent RNA polymerase beta' subunit/160 kD subunit [Giardia duodenalis assemblage B]|uniref:DNA-dependent RNA polymerase beta' subunit/160 kD subunit n=1 Tax=Giardia duodenalis assemblage B TaxID=1394984 RepID=A0A132NZ32_GIAIN|nr:DNA-dependent RNA polymerase beta' subunit/160 kD subunit [Giardia intestinalis assemblage B]
MQNEKPGDATDGIKLKGSSIESASPASVALRSIKPFSRARRPSLAKDTDDNLELCTKEASSPKCAQPISECQPNIDRLTIFKDQRRDTPNRLRGLSLPSILASNLSFSAANADNLTSQVIESAPEKPTNTAGKAHPTTPRDIHDKKCSIKQYIKMLLPLKTRVNGEETEPPILKTHQLRSERREKKMYAPLSYSEERHALNYSARFDKQLNNVTSVSGGINRMITVLSSPASTPRKSTSVSSSHQSSSQAKKTIVPKLGISTDSIEGIDGPQTNQYAGESKSARGFPKERLTLSNESDMRGALTARSTNPSTIGNGSTISKYIDRENIIELIRIYDSTRQILHNDLAVKKARINELRNGIERSIKISVMRNLPNYCPAGFQCILRLPCCHYTFQDKERRLIGEFCQLCHVETRATVLVNILDCYGSGAYAL